MIVRSMVSLLLLHHIEGVCRPWSAATMIAKAAAERAAEATAELAAKAAEVRAEARTARVLGIAADRTERARAAALSGAEAVKRAVAGRRAAGALPEAPPVVVDGFVVRVEQEHRR